MPLEDRLKQVRGVVVERLGDWRDAKVGTLPVRLPGPDQILIECEAAGLNFHDLLVIDGKYQVKPETPFFPGGEIAGRVAAVGPSVTAFKVGQRVASGTFLGAFAEFALAPVGRTYPLPEEIDPVKAAGSRTSFATVAVALTIRGGVEAGRQILITGAAGGVGVAAIQYARMIGCETVALVSSEAKEKIARSAGADHVLRIDRMADPKTEMYDALQAAGIDGVDVVLDVVGGDVFDATVRCLRPGGQYLVVGFASGRIPEIKINYLLLKSIALVGSALEYGLQHEGPRLGEIMGRIFQAVARGELDPFVRETFPFEQFGLAAERIASRTAVGKIVLIP